MCIYLQFTHLVYYWIHLHIHIHHAKHVICIFSFKPHQFLHVAFNMDLIALALQMKKVRNEGVIIFTQDHTAKG